MAAEGEEAGRAAGEESERPGGCSPNKIDSLVGTLASSALFKLACMSDALLEKLYSPPAPLMLFLRTLPHDFCARNFGAVGGAADGAGAAATGGE